MEAESERGRVESRVSKKKTCQSFGSETAWEGGGPKRMSTEQEGEKILETSSRVEKDLWGRDFRGGR